MADKKISQLTNITGANLADDDEFVVVDTSVDETKAITYGELRGVVTPADLTLDSLDLAAIAESKGVTAVDVFVYDTSKDSDGGAWRKRTQHTSWYNEPLNTATRGARREFPAVAVIVAESGKVTIYDGDDPSLPMWMVFNVGVNNLVSSGEPTSLAALEGLLIVGKASNNGLAKINMINDNGSVQSTAGFFEYKSVVSARNDTSGFSAASGDGIVNSTVNDVSMTILPDAPTDPATGLPVPTIAVATAGGVSVIKDDGIVANHNLLLSYQGVSFDNDNRLYYGTENSQFRFAEPSVWKTPSFTQSGSYRYKNLSVGAFPVINTSTSGTLIPPVGRGLDLAVAVKSGGIGVTHLRHTPSDKDASLVAYTAATYATGWLPGDIKGAFLADTDETDLVSEDFAVNGSFESDASGWSLGTDWAHDPVNQRLGRVGSTYHNAFPTATIAKLVIGQSYTMEVECGVGAGTVGYYTSSGVYGALASGINRISFTYKGGNYPFFYSSSNERWIDNFRVFRSSHDRSVNADGKRPSDLIVNGTVTRSPVATGADLVAYSGFSTSNYLEQPYNSDLDFGTGDFCVMGWFNRTSDGYLVDTIDAALTEGFAVFSSGGTLYFRTRNGSNSQVISSALTNNVWTHFAAVRTESGTLHSIYLNGVLNASVSGVARSIGGTSSPMRIGQYNAGTSPFGGSLALMRISATAPTAEQIAKIYNDEKVLFTEGSQATLYGTSDAVTALAHDDDTNLLHVGTSDGRSVFQGLRRVENTTAAVGTAISASNGLVVEE